MARGTATNSQLVLHLLLLVGCIIGALARARGILELSAALALRGRGLAAFV